MGSDLLLVLIIILIVATMVMDILIELLHPRTRNILELPIGAVQLVIYLGVPAFAWLVARDIWLRRAIRRQPALRAARQARERAGSTAATRE